MPCCATQGICIIWFYLSLQLSGVGLLSHQVMPHSATPWTAAFQASLSFSISQSLLRFMSIEPVMPSNHLILCQPFLLLLSVFPSIRDFSNELALCIRWPYRWESWGLEGVNNSLKRPLTSRESGFRQKPPVPNVTSGPARTWGSKTEPTFHKGASIHQVGSRPRCKMTRSVNSHRHQNTPDLMTPTQRTPS